MNKTTLLYIGILILVAASYFILADHAESGPEAGDIAPMLSMEAPDGDTLRLKELKGQMTLVNFWASWCRPCREKNPELVALYDKYNGQKFTEGSGFEIYSVSLDRDKNAWISGIEAQDLQWPFHVSDLQRFNSASVDQYGVSSIPVSFLLNGEGKILLRTSNVDEIDEMLAGLLAGN